MNHILLFLLFSSAAAYNCTRTKVVTHNEPVNPGEMLYRFVGLAVAEVNNAYANSRGLDEGELDLKTNPFAGTHEHVEDGNIKRIGLRHILVRLDESIPFAVKELTAFDANGKEIGHVDYAVQYDDHLSLDFVILRNDSFEKAMESCKEVAKIDKGSVYGIDGKINSLL